MFDVMHAECSQTDGAELSLLCRVRLSREQPC